MPGLFMITAVTGWIIDFRYKRAGGERPTKSDKIQLLVVC
jgi:hypothetical protein